MIIDKNVCMIRLTYMDEIGNEFIDVQTSIPTGESSVYVAVSDLINHLEYSLGGISTDKFPWLLDLLGQDESIIDTISLSEEQAIYVSQFLCNGTRH